MTTEQGLKELLEEMSKLQITLPLKIHHQPIIEKLKSDPTNNIFDGKQFVVGNSAGTTSIEEELAIWLLKRAKHVGADSALIEIETYKNAENFPLYIIMPLPYIHFEDNYKFNNSIELCHINDLSVLLENTNLYEKYFSEFTRYFLKYTLSQKKLHLNPNDPLVKESIKKYSKEITHIVQIFDVTNKLISLMGDVKNGIHASTHHVLTAPDVPRIQAIGCYFYPGKTPKIGLSINKQQLDDTNRLLKKFENLELTDQNKLLVQLTYLNNFGSGEEMADRAINLRVCLESIFMNSDRGDNRYKVSTRGALFLGSNLEERKEIRSTLKKGYDISSDAVHSGKSPTNDKLKTLNQAAELAKQALIKLIENGPVNWEDIELQA